MDERDEQGAVHGSKGQVIERVSCCAAFLTLPECQRTFEREISGRVKKEFCSLACKDAYHRVAHQMGRAAIEAMKGKSN